MILILLGRHPELLAEAGREVARSLEAHLLVDLLDQEIAAADHLRSLAQAVGFHVVVGRYAEQALDLAIEVRTAHEHLFGQLFDVERLFAEVLLDVEVQFLDELRIALAETERRRVGVPRSGKQRTADALPVLDQAVDLSHQVLGGERQIITRMRELGIEPVFPGYAGMVPRNIGEKLGYQIADPGKWCGFPRPAFLSTEDEHFDSFAAMYYEELEKLYGKAKYYSMDPFHEGGNTEGVDLAKAGTSIMGAMKKANPEAVWVMQAWQANPREAMVSTLDSGDLLVLDLYSEKLPQWGDPESMWYREKGFGKHDWLYCMLLNFGGNVGLHGRMEQLVNGYYNACAHVNGKTLRGVGATPEGIENNPVMFELLYELPWREERFSPDVWLQAYLKARYGNDLSPEVAEAWRALEHTVYNAPKNYQGEGTVESLLCARPGFHLDRTSTWGYAKLFYSSDSTAKAARLLLSVADQYKGIITLNMIWWTWCVRAWQIRGMCCLKKFLRVIDRKDKDSFGKQSQQFLELILAQDSLLSTRKEFSVSSWLNAARSLGTTEEEKKLYEWNASALITVWGDSIAANQGGLHDYSHREWSGILKDLYYQRWKTFFEQKQRELDGKLDQSAEEPINFYGMEKAWAEKNKTADSSDHKLQNVIETAKSVYRTAIEAK